MNNSYLTSLIRQFEYYKMLGEKAIAQLQDDQLFWQYTSETNSIAIIINHLAGNMLSRFTDFLTSDGEKPWRNRDEEFELPFKNRDELMAYWQDGWKQLFDTLQQIEPSQLEDLVFIRNEGHTITEALNRQLAHYPYHIGQIVLIAKMVVKENWQDLSIPRNQSQRYNEEKFSQAKGKRHFTDGLQSDSL